MKRLGIALVCIASLMAGGLLGQQARPSTASVEGIVVEAGTGQPLPKSSLDLRSADDLSKRYPGLAGEGGRFSFRNVPPGRYTLTASRNGYMHAEYEQRGPNGKGQTLTVASGEQRDGIRLAMTRSAAISGHVFGSTGKPAAYVQIQARRISYPGGVRTLTIISGTVTDNLGAYRFYGLPAGQYVLSAQTNPGSLGIQPVLASATPPVPGTVMFQSASGPMQYDADPANANRRSGESSLSYFPGVSDDRDARVYELRPGDDVPAIDTTTALAAPVTVSGLVSGDIAVNSAVAITIAPLSGGSSTSQRVNAQRGAFTVPLAPGGYIANATARGQGGSIAGYAFIEVRPGNAPTISINMVPPTQFSGRVSIEGRETQPSDPDLGKIQIAFNRYPPLPIGSGGRSQTLAPKPDGSLTCPAQCLMDGDYDIALVSLVSSGPRRGAVGRTVASDVISRDNPEPQMPEGLRGLFVKSIRATNAEIANGWLRVPARTTGTAGTVEVEIVLSLNGGQISGVARNNEGAAQSNVVVVLAPEQQDRQSLYKSTVTTADGRFTFEGIPPGTYRLLSWEDIQQDDWRNPSVLTATQDRGKTVRIAEGARETIDAIVIPTHD